MTVAVILAGLFPLLISTGTGSEVMQRLAAPMIGGMITAPLLSLFVLPAIYKLLGAQRFARQDSDEQQPQGDLPTEAKISS
jgi:Cu(I)/Ag(I) efflux system membrane protein CusA/SilA